MAPQNVVFAFRNKRYERKFDRKLLSLNNTVWVTTNEGGEAIDFYVDQQPEAIAVRVVWISPSDWTVTLGEGNAVLPNLEQRVHDTVGALVAMSDIECALKSQRNLLKRTDFVSDASLTGEFMDSPLHVIATVIDRMDLCRRLGNLDVQEALFAHHEPLVIYLCLTCFDRLGQPAAHVSFGDWLSSNRQRIRVARESVVTSDDMTPTEIAQLYHVKYLEEFGVKSSFFRFLNSVLPENKLAKLLASFEIDRQENPPSLKRLSPADDEAKKAFLFKLRNDYTHNGNFKGGIGPDLLPATNSGLWRIGYYQEFRANDWRSVKVLNWPNIFHECVRHGLAAYIRTLSTENEACS